MPHWSIFPTFSDVRAWLEAHYRATLSFDLESTYQGDVMCMGLWPVDNWLDEQGICIPLLKQGGKPYWDNQLDRLRVMDMIFTMLRDPHWAKVGQNVAGFDIPLMRKAWGIETQGLLGDTMIAHSLVMPELPHSLAFLSSIFTDLSPYKIEVHETSTEEKDDTDKWENIQHYDDYKLREYCLLDTFATAGSWVHLERMMS